MSNGLSVKQSQASAVKANFSCPGSEAQMDPRISRHGFETWCMKLVLAWLKRHLDSRTRTRKATKISSSLKSCDAYEWNIPWIDRVYIIDIRYPLSIIIMGIAVQGLMDTFHAGNNATISSEVENQWSHHKIGQTFNLIFYCRFGVWNPDILISTKGGGGGHSTVDSILASHPAATGSILGVPKIFSDLDVIEIYRQRALLRQWTVQRA